MEKMDRYARQFADAMKRTGMRNTTVASYLGGQVQVANVSHWRTGRRGIPRDHAVAIGVLLGIAPEKISKAYDLEVRAKTALNSMAAQGSRTGVVADGYVAVERIEQFGAMDLHNRLVLPEMLVRRELGMIPVENVQWTILQSQIMEPEIKRHSLLLVDVTIRDLAQVVDNGIYAYTLWGRADVRRIVIHKDAWSLKGGGARDRDMIRISENESSNIKIIGAVVGWL